MQILTHFFWVFTLCIFFNIPKVESQNTDLLLGLPKKEGYTRSTRNYVQVKNDTMVIWDCLWLAEKLSRKRYWLNLDSVRLLTNKGYTLSEKAHFNQGKISAYMLLGWAFKFKDINDSARYYYKKGIQIDELICNEGPVGTEGPMATHYSFYADALMGDAMIDSAIIWYKKVKELAESRSDYENIRYSLKRLSNAYRISGDYPAALKYSYELLEIGKMRCDTSEMVDAYRSLFYIFNNLNQVDKTLEVLRSSLTLTASWDLKWKWWLHYMAMQGYMMAEQYDSVIYYARINLPIDDLVKEPRMGYQMISQAYMQLNQMDSAEYYMHLFYQQAIQTGQMDVGTYLSLGSFEFRKRNWSKALDWYKEAEKKYKNETLYGQRMICLHLAQLYDTTHQTSLALRYFKKYNSLNDSIHAHEKKFETGIAIKEKESTKLENQITLLAKEKELQSTLASKQKQQKNIVYAGSGLILLLLVGGFYRFRKSRELKSKQELLNERLRISRDLHDEVGATLSGIAMYSHLAKEQINDFRLPEVKDSLSIIQQSSGEMVGKLSDIVWLLNPEHDSLQNLVEKLEDYAKQMANIKGTRVKMNVPDKVQDIHLSVEQRRNIYLLCKESINNAVKYSQGTLLEIKVNYFERKLEISIEDNGLGFDMASVKLGNGLENLKKRASTIGADLFILTSPGTGTKIRLEYTCDS